MPTLSNTRMEGNYIMFTFKDGTYCVKYFDGPIKGTEIWYNKDCQIHRENDLPAMIKPNGAKYWYFNGKQFRENGKPTVEDPQGAIKWYSSGKFSKSDGPAIR